MKYLKKATQKIQQNQENIKAAAAVILEAVRTRGDEAVAMYGRAFDQSLRKEWRVTQEEIQEAYQSVDPSLLEDMKAALKNIARFATFQKKTLSSLEEVEISPGVFAGQRVLPVESCCCYVPGGSYPLFSTALMLITPAKKAGVRRVVATSPVMKGTDRIHPTILAAMDLAGADEIYAMGGVPAIGAFAYGTESIQKVDMIVGPGNAYVTEAKRQCFGIVGIDFLAGPSEVLILADETADASLITADLLAQAEHDPSARALLITTDEALGEKVLNLVEEELKQTAGNLPRQAWEDNGEILIATSMEEACRQANQWAPEHLEVMTEDPGQWMDQLYNYGALFLGQESAEVFGDYSSGTNHTLPTVQAARYTGGLWVGTFLKVCTHQYLTPRGLEEKVELTKRLARGEGLVFHEKAAEARKSLL